jgi:hypothetical protein
MPCGQHLIIPIHEKTILLESRVTARAASPTIRITTDRSAGWCDTGLLIRSSRRTPEFALTAGRKGLESCTNGVAHGSTAAKRSTANPVSGTRASEQEWRLICGVNALSRPSTPATLLSQLTYVASC